MGVIQRVNSAANWPMASLLTLAACVGWAGAARAQTVLSGAQSAPIESSTVNAGSPDDIEIASGAVVTIGAAGVNGVTLDSPNTLTLDSGATITATDFDHVRGVVVTQFGSAPLTLNGAIALGETYTAADTNSDGFIDQPFAVGTDRIGVLIEARASALVGDITLGDTASIAVEGNDSAGLRILGAVTGSLSNAGAVTIIGDNSIGVDIGAAVSGDVSQTGAIEATGENAVGLQIGGDIGGAVSIGAAISAKGYRYTIVPSDDATYAKLISNGVLQGGSAVSVSASIGQGLEIAGIGYETDSTESTATPSGVVSVLGAAPALSIGNLSSAITLGAGDPIVDGTPGAGLPALNIGYGLYNRGTISASGVYRGVDTTAVSIFGANAGAHTTLANGLRNDNAISAQALYGNATAVTIGDWADVARLYNNGAIHATVTSNGAQSATAVLYGANAGGATLTNQGDIQSSLFGQTGESVAVRSLGNALTLIENYASIYAGVTQTDASTPVTASTIAIDVSGASVGVTVRQMPSIARTDQDSVDNAAEPIVQIVGDVLFGSGADTLDLQAGQLIGNVDFGGGAGADIFTITGGASARGAFTSNGLLTLDIEDGSLFLTSGSLAADSAHVGANGLLTLSIDENAAISADVAVTNTFTFDSGARLAVNLDSLPSSGAFLSTGQFTQNVITAGSFSGLGTLAVDLTGPYLFVSTLEQPDANTLAVQVRRKTATELGFDANEAAAYDAVYGAVAGDAGLSSAFAAIQDAATFNDAYHQMLPSALAASTELALAGGLAVSNAALARVGGDTALAANAVSAWGQQFGGTLTRDVDTWGGAWDGWQWGVATGIDGPLGDGGALGQLGVMAAFQISEIDDRRRTTDTLANWRLSLGAYWAHDLPGGAYLRAAALVGAGKTTLERNIDIVVSDPTRSVSRAISGEWTNAAATVQADINRPIAMGPVTVTPRVGAIFASTWDDGYQESGGGGANLVVDARSMQRIYADAGLDARVALDFGVFHLSPEFGIGWRQRVSGDPASIDARFQGQTTSFTLTDMAESDGRALANLGLTFDQGPAHVTLRLDGEQSSEYERYTAEVRLRVEF
ncbi:MAG: autotransporter domain-containing protein [Hyphomonadaceae bacterium]